MHELIKYPQNDFDRSGPLLAVLGNFWTDIFTAGDELHSYVTATAFNTAETQRQLLEMFAAISHYTVPVFHKKNLVVLKLTESEMNTGGLGSARFNQTQYVFDGDLKFDQSITSGDYKFPLPSQFVRCNQIIDSPTVPKTVLQRNFDFFIDEGGSISFARNPFLGDFPVVAEQGSRAIYVWLVAAEYDYKYVYNQFAYALNLKLKSSEGYKQLTSALLGSLTNGGASVAAVNLALAAICDTPLTIEKEERVEKIFEDAHGRCIVTDKHSYRFPLSARPIVSLRQKINRGQPLVDTLVVTDTVAPNRFLELQDNQPLYDAKSTVYLITQSFDFIETQAEEDIVLKTGFVCPAPIDDLRAIALGPGLLAPCFHGEILFENKLVDIAVDENHRSGHTYVSFELNGHPADVRRFFDETHDRAVNAPREPCDGHTIGYPRTLARCLARWKIDAEPKKADIPVKINPLQFLISNVLRNNVFIVRIRLRSLGQNRLELYNINQIRALLPPQTAMLVVLTYEAQPDTVSNSLLAETQEFFTGLNQVYDTALGTGVLDNGARLFAVSGNCQ
jgi:hypothetical protein